MFNTLQMQGVSNNINDITFSDYYFRLKMIAQSVFKWNNLPNGIDEKWIEKYLFSDGKCMIFKDPVLGFMIAKCTESGKLNYYDEPTKLRPIATYYPGAGKLKTYENGVDCVLIGNNDEYMCTHVTMQLYAYRLAEISRTIDININAMKTPTLIKCSEKQRVSLRNVYRQWNGCEPVLFGDKSLETEGIQALKTDAPIVFDKLQIQKHAIWNECMTFLGINNANMDKRERLVDDEVQANNEQIMSCADLMLKTREKACERINDIFDLNVSVEMRNVADMPKFEGMEGNE